MRTREASRVDNWVVIAALLSVSLLLGIVGVALFLGVLVMMLRRRPAAVAAEETLIKVPPRGPSYDKTSPAIPAHLAKAPPKPVTRVPTPAKPAAKPGLAAPPPPKPLGVNPIPAKPGKPQAPPAFPSFYDDGKKGPLLGLFDEEKKGPGEEAKTELFNRDTAKRYAEMLDDEDDGDHTELFSSYDIDDAVGGGAILDEDSTGAGKVPGRIVAKD